MQRWLEPEKGGSFDDERSRTERYARVRKRCADAETRKEVERLAKSRTAGIWRTKRAKIVLATANGRSVERLVLEVRVPPQSVVLCQEGFAENGMKYFDIPVRKPTQREAAVERMLAFLENPPGPRSCLWEQISVGYVGHEFSARQIEKIRGLIEENPSTPVAGIARVLCSEFGIVQANGKWKTTQVSQILSRMQMDNLIELSSAGKKGDRPAPKPVPETVRPPRRRIALESRLIERLVLVRVRTKKELALWRELIERFHYIGKSKLFGRQLRYLAFGQGECLKQMAKAAYGRTKGGGPDPGAHKSLFDGDRLVLGALGFAGAAWRLSSREHFIGWDEKRRRKNLDLVVNNSRFLIVPWIKSPNLASRILGAAARRLPDDWQEQYARRPVLLETFVGLDKFKGTCYLAANWIRIGATEGYSLHPEYRKRAEAKGIFVYPLEKNFRQILCETD